MQDLEEKKDIEIEIRGPLSDLEHTTLKEFLHSHGKAITTKDRVLIDYSSFLPGEMKDRKKDIRLRITNGVPEIIVKIGGWGGIDQRKELSVTTGHGTFDTLAEIFGALGYEKGVLCIRKTLVYEYKDIEFALVEVPGHSYFFEAEKMAHEGEDGAKIADDITAVCKELGLRTFNNDEFFAYMAQLNTEANEVFDFVKEGSGYFKKRFGF